MEHQAAHDVIKGLCFNPAHLALQQVKKLDENELSEVYERVMPGFCYDNAFLTAVALGAEAVVYGAALTAIGGTLQPIEHAWVRFADGRCVDPTYQKLEQDGGVPLDVDYYKLFEIPTLDYVEIAQELGNNLAGMVAMDFLWFRRSRKYQYLFDVKAA